MIRASVVPTVGIAPGTTTLRLNGASCSNGLKGPSCPPDPAKMPGSSWVPPKGWKFTELTGPGSGMTKPKFYNPYADIASLKQAGLGIVLSPDGRVPGAYPWEINRTGPSNAPQLTPFDPQYNQRGERGYYYDTQLGSSIPTDAEQGRNLCYTPVQNGWVYAKEGYIPGPWTPPNGWSPAGAYGPPTSLTGPGMLGSFVDDVTTHNRLLLFFTALSSVAIAATACYTIFKKCR